MTTGKPGDPLTDIILHRRKVYSDTADALVVEIVLLADDAEHQHLEELLLTRFDPSSRPDITQLEGVLEEMRNRLRHEVRERGREITD